MAHTELAEINNTNDTKTQSPQEEEEKTQNQPITKQQQQSDPTTVEYVQKVKMVIFSAVYRS